MTPLSLSAKIMSKIHPAVKRLDGAGTSLIEHRMVWTVWKKSSMAFQGTDGFSVYDSEGRLAFRLDNYSRPHKFLSGELILMDGAGRALYSLWPQMLTMHDRWNGSKACDDSATGLGSPTFSVRRRSILQQVDEAEVFMGQSLTPSFIINGSFRQRSCKILESSTKLAAEISRKKVCNSVELGDDVFNLLVQPGVDCQLMIALVVVLDRIFDNSYSPILCS